MPSLGSSLAKDVHAIESVQKSACKMATHNWNANYHELLLLAELLTLDRRRLELLGNFLGSSVVFAILPMKLSNLGSRHLFLAILGLFIFSTSINLELIQIPVIFGTQKFCRTIIYRKSYLANESLSFSVSGGSKYYYICSPCWYIQLWLATHFVIYKEWKLVFGTLLHRWWSLVVYVPHTYFFIFYPCVNII